jgi:hypothetical protein
MGKFRRKQCHDTVYVVDVQLLSTCIYYKISGLLAVYLSIPVPYIRVCLAQYIMSIGSYG